MARFRFPLERVLTWRETLLSAEQVRLENLRAQLRAAEAAREDLIAGRMRMQREIEEASAVTGHDLARLDSFRAWAARQETALAARAVELHRAIAEQTARVVAADRNVRLIGRLKERRREAWCEEEQRGLDEMAGESSVAQWRRRELILRR